MTDTIRQITKLWPRVSRLVLDRLRSAFRGSELPPLALGLLHTLGQQPGLTVSDLAREAHVAKSYVSRTVDQLVTLGHLERRADETDQRLARLYETDTADVIKHELRAAAEQAWAEALAQLSPEELQTVAAGLNILLTTLSPNLDEGQETSPSC